MGIKVYGPAESQSVARVLLCLEEVEAKYEHVQLDFAAGEHKSPKQLARNVISHNERTFNLLVMSFVNSGVHDERYILRKCQSDILRVGNLKESAMVDVWLDVESNQYNPPVSSIVVEEIFKPFLGCAREPEIVNLKLEKLEKALEVYESRLSQGKYLAGDFVSLADISHIPYTYYLMLSPHDSLFDSYPHVKAWWEDLLKRPSIGKVVAIFRGFM